MIETEASTSTLSQLIQAQLVQIQLQSEEIKLKILSHSEEIKAKYHHIQKKDSSTITLKKL